MGIVETLRKAEVLAPNPTEEEFVAARKHGVGGSDAGALCGMSKWKKTPDLFLDKTGDADPVVVNIAMRAGSFMEPFIREIHKEHNDQVTVLDAVGTIRHKEYPFILANVDDIGVDQFGTCVIEYKNVSLAGAKGWADGNTPPHYWAQVQWYMGVLNSHFEGEEEFDHAWMVGLMQNRKLQVNLIQRDPEWFAMAVERAKVFWTAVQNRDMGYLMDCDDDPSLDIVKFAHPGDNSVDAVELDADIEDQLAMLEHLYSDKSRVEGEIKECQARVGAALGDATKGNSERFKVSWPAIAGRMRFNSKLFLEGNPDFDKAPYEVQGKSYRGAMKVTRRKR